MSLETGHARRTRRSAVPISLLLLGSFVITSCTTSGDSKSEQAGANWFTPLIEEVVGTLDDICEIAVCVDSSVVLPAQRVVLATTDIDMPDTLGALTLNRIWIGEGEGIFGEGWTSVWDITLTDETLTGALPGRPLELPRSGSPIALSDGSRLTIDDQGRVVEFCESEAICTLAVWEEDSLLLRPSRATTEEIRIEIQGDVAVSATAGDGRSVRYLYESNRLTQAVSSSGVESYEYSDDGLLVQFDSPGSRRSFVYEDGRVVQMADQLGGIWSIASLDDHNIDVLRPDGAKRSYRFSEGRLIEASDSVLGVLLRREYRDSVLYRDERPADGTLIELLEDSRIRFTQQTSDLSPTVAIFAYDAQGRIIETESADGLLSYRYEGLGVAPKAVSSSTGVFTYEYDRDGLVIAATDADGYRVSIERGANGLPVRVTDELTEMEFAYDSAGRIVAQTSGGQTDRARFDALGRLVETTTASGSDTRYFYDDLGRVTRVEGAETTDLTYASEGWLDEASTALLGLSGPITTNRPVVVPWLQNSDGTYTRSDVSGVTETADRWGRVIRIEAGGRVTEREFDEAGRLIRSVGPDGAVGTTYTPAGRVATVSVDGVEISVQWAGELMTSLEMSTGTSYKFEYDRAGRLTTTLQGGLRWDYEYDSDGSLTKVRTPTGPLAYRWSDTGRPIATVLPSGAERSYQWDANGEILSVSSADGEEVKIERNDSGRVEIVRVGDSATRVEFDDEGRITSYRIGDGPKVSVSYSAEGVSALAVGDTVELWSYSEDGVIESVTRGEDRFTLDWAAPGLLRTVSRGSSVLAVASIDQGGRVTEVLDHRGESVAAFDWSSLGVSSAVVGSDSLRIERDAEGLLTSVIDRNEVLAEFSYLQGVLSRLGVGEREIDFRYQNGRLLETDVSTPEGEVRLRWGPDGYAVESFDGSVGSGGFEYDIAGVVTAITLGNERSEVGFDDQGRAKASGRTGDLLSDLFTPQGRFGGLQMMGAGPIAPLLDLLPSELALTLPTPTTPDEIVEVALAAALPQLPRPLVPTNDSGWSVGMIDSTLGIGAQVSVPVGPNQSVASVLRPGAVDLGALITAAPALRTAESVLDRLGPGPCLLCRVADFGSGALRSIGSVASTAVSFFLTNPITKAVATVAFVGAAAAASFLCQSRGLCQVGAIVAPLVLAQLLSGGDVGLLRGLYETVAAPVRSLIGGVISFDAAVLASGAAAVIALASRRIYNGAPVQSRLIQQACRSSRVACLSYSQYPGAAANYLAAQSAGVGRVSRVNRIGIAERRQSALAGIPIRAGLDRDEAPPAFLRANSRRVSVSYISPTDNRGAGASLGRQLSPVRNGRGVFVLITR